MTTDIVSHNKEVNVLARRWLYFVRRFFELAKKLEVVKIRPNIHNLRQICQMQKQIR